MTKEQFIDKYKGKAVWCKTEELAKEFLKMADSCGFNNTFKKEFFKKEFQGSGVYFYIYEKNDPNRSVFYNDIEFNRVYETVEKREIIEYKPEEQEEKPKNLIPLIAKELGVEIGERFKVDFEKKDRHYWAEFTFLNDDLFFHQGNYLDTKEVLFDLITGVYEIQKLPKKPKLTEAERVILENLPKEYKLIKRSRYGLFVYDNGIGSVFEYLNMFSHLFQFIKQEDEEAYKIQDLLEEYENLRSE